MGIFNFFRFKKKKEETFEVKLLEVSEIRKKILERINFIEEDMGIIVKDFSPKKEEFIQRLSEKISLLEGIDLVGKRERERIKLINLQNLRDYVKWLHRLSSKLVEINGKGINYFLEIDLAVGDFIKNSRRNLALATILIGDEIAQTEGIIKDFHKSVLEIFSQNNSSILDLKKLNELKIITKEIIDIEEFIESLEKNILVLGSKKEDKYNEGSILVNGLEAYKSSSKFIEWEKKKNEFLEQKNLVDRKVLEIKDSIDLKELSKKFHGSKKTKDLIESYRFDFSSSLKKDRDLEITSFINGGDSKLSSSIKSLREDLFELEKKKELFESNLEIEGFNLRIRSCFEEEKKLEEEKKAEEKKKDKFVNKKNELINEFNSKVEGIQSLKFRISFGD